MNLTLAHAHLIVLVPAGCLLAIAGAFILLSQALAHCRRRWRVR